MNLIKMSAKYPWILCVCPLLNRVDLGHVVSPTPDVLNQNLEEKGLGLCIFNECTWWLFMTKFGKHCFRPTLSGARIQVLLSKSQNKAEKQGFLDSEGLHSVSRRNLEARFSLKN